MFKNICWAQKLFALMIFALFVMSIASSLSGCGNKGDLYLPDEKGSVSKSKNTDTVKTPKKR